MMKISICLLLCLVISGCSSQRQLPLQSESDLWRAASEPNEAHQVFRQLHGKWETKSTYWPSVGATPESSRGRAKGRLMFGGRFLHEDFFGQMYGRAFNGLGVMGYDNVAKEYNSYWVDSLSTAMSLSKGTYKPSAKVFEFLGSYTDPVTGKKKPTRSLLHIPNRDLHRLEMFERDPKGREFKTLEVEYSRIGDVISE